MGGLKVLHLANGGDLVREKRKEIMRFTITIEQDEDGIFVAECPAIPGCISQGKTEKEVLENIKDAIKQCLEVRAEKGMPLTVAMREIEVMV